MALIARTVQLAVHPALDCLATVQHVSLHCRYRLVVFVDVKADTFTTVKRTHAQQKMFVQQENT